jgi:hypothetical protein
MERKAKDLGVGDYAYFSPNTKAGTSGRQPEINGVVIGTTAGQNTINLIVMVKEGQSMVKKSIGGNTSVGWLKI